MWIRIAVLAAVLVAGVIAVGIYNRTLIGVGRHEKELDDRRDTDRRAIIQQKEKQKLEACDHVCLEEALRKQMEEFNRR